MQESHPGPAGGRGGGAPTMSRRELPVRIPGRAWQAVCARWPRMTVLMRRLRAGP